jgi:hypothetical protein
LIWASHIFGEHLNTKAIIVTVVGVILLAMMLFLPFAKTGGVITSLAGIAIGGICVYYGITLARKSKQNSMAKAQRFNEPWKQEYADHLADKHDKQSAQVNIEE